MVADDRTHRLAERQLEVLRLGLRTLAERREALRGRDLAARARIAYDGDGRRSDLEPLPAGPPLTVDDHLDLLVVEAELRKLLSRSRQIAVWRARAAGASWAHISFALLRDTEDVRREYLEWVREQVAAWESSAYDRSVVLDGFDPAERAAALALADPD